eukprot:scaffold5088_cov308-Prasinococcus_capsulatus_cf.AAC.1
MPSDRKDVVTRQYTINLHKRLHGITFKRKAPRAVKEIKAFAKKHMGTSDVRLDVKLNKAIWSRGIRCGAPSASQPPPLLSTRSPPAAAAGCEHVERHVPGKLRIQIARKRNDDEDAKEELYSYVTHVEGVTSFDSLGTKVRELRRDANRALRAAAATRRRSQVERGSLTRGWRGRRLWTTRRTTSRPSSAGARPLLVHYTIAARALASELAGSLAMLEPVSFAPAAGGSCPGASSARRRDRRRARAPLLPALQRNAAQCNAVQCNAMQCNVGGGHGTARHDAEGCRARRSELRRAPRVLLSR